MGTLDRFITDVQDELRTISGINFVPEYPADSVPTYPFVPVMASDGNSDHHKNPGLSYWLHNVRVGLLAPREDININTQIILPKLEPIVEGLQKELLSSTSRFKPNISTFGVLNYVSGPIEWGGIMMLGFMIEITGVKIKNTL